MIANPPNNPPTAALGIRPLSEREFVLFQKLIYGKAGIYLSPGKKALLEARLTSRIRQLGGKSFGEYFHQVVDDPEGTELIQLLDRISTNETHFFREPRQFEFLEQQIFPRWAEQGAAGLRPRLIRVWSAGCSTGEEPYSIAMTVLDHFPPAAGWQVEILATDLSSRVLDLARKAVWPIAKSAEIPHGYLKRFMLKGSGSQVGNMKAGPEIVSVVRFERVNLNDEFYSVGGRFDVIFCRNVLIYFDAASRARVIERLLNHLAPSGYFFIGHAETLNGVTERVRNIMPTIYVHAAAPQPNLSAGAVRTLEASVAR
jgi:chemotaxis protein methyltransferase CheR